MSKKEKARTTKSYYLPGDPNKTPLTHDEFCELMRPFWRQRKALERARECNPPRHHVCMCDCCDCPYRRRGNTVDFDILESAGKEVADPVNMEDAAVDRIFREQIIRCLPQLDAIDRIIIRCTVLHAGKLTERQIAALVSKAIGRTYSHQAVHKRIPTAARRLAALLRYPI